MDKALPEGYWLPGTKEYDEEVKRAAETKIGICECMHALMDHFGDHCKVCLCRKERFAYTTTIKEQYTEDFKKIIGQIVDDVKEHTK